MLMAHDDPLTVHNLRVMPAGNVAARRRRWYSVPTSRVGPTPMPTCLPGKVDSRKRMRLPIGSNQTVGPPPGGFFILARTWPPSTGPSACHPEMDKGDFVSQLAGPDVQSKRG